jgi:NAD(P)-dependent dehydrogenase (short-subunit alcohol dehydrogenase family)
MDSAAPVQSVVLGASGAIGGAFVRLLRARGDTVREFSRSGPDHTDICDEQMVAAAAQQAGDGLDLVIVASGFLHDQAHQPEKALRQLAPDHLMHSFRVNALGPALAMKHFLPRLAKGRRSVFAVISARVGSIADNKLGGWYSYRASKAALNQLVRTASIELSRTNPNAVCLALHPGTVETPLSAPFHKAGLAVRSPGDAARDLMAVLEQAGPDQTGAFVDYAGQPIPF